MKKVKILAVMALMGALNFALANEKINYQEALDIAKREFNGASVIAVELDKGFYEIKSYKDGIEKEIKIDINSGEIVKLETEKKQISDELLNVKISLNKAKDMVMSENADWNFKEIELKQDLGVIYYEVELKKGFSEKEIKIDANSGKILQIKQK